MITKEYYDQYQLVKSQYDCMEEEILKRVIEIGLMLKYINEKEDKVDTFFIEKNIVYVNYTWWSGESTDSQYRFPIEYLWSDDLLSLERQRRIEEEEDRKLKILKDEIRQKEIDKANRYCLYETLKSEFEGK